MYRLHNRQPHRFAQKKTRKSDVVQMILQNQGTTSKIAVTETAKHQFTNFPLKFELLKNIAFRGYTSPTPIQDQAITPILEGKDVIGIAHTGTGKTAAFLIPLIEKTLRNNLEKILIVTPTRELALQIQQELISLTKNLGIFSTLCIGGTSFQQQIFSLKRKNHFVIGTPGRLKDLVLKKFINLGDFRTVVLDEADRMIDIGFIREIKFFISLLPKNRQSLFFSATISDQERDVLRNFVKNPTTVSVKQQDMKTNIKQNLIKVVNQQKKVDQLHDLLIQDGFEKVLIFGRTKWGIQKLSNELVKRGFKADAIHGNKRQNQRQRVLEKFKRSEIKILLATDVASRGLDIENVSHVINYDLPESYADYIHRIGRTGRADKTGVALTFVD